MTDRAADLFAWQLGEVSASLATCPPAAFHVTGLRLERVGENRWWGDLHGYRADLERPFTWQGFGLRRDRAWDVAFPPYLADLDPHWRAAIARILETMADHALADPARAAAVVHEITVEAADGIPRPAAVGGDRITPGNTYTAIWVHHAKRYRFAADYAAGKTVLDLGCGVGYGSRMLARRARRVVAIDLAPHAVAHAARAYASARLVHGAADARRLPFADASFDLVTCFEMIEHIEDHATLLAEIARVLKPEGQLIVSTPNKRFYEDQPDPEHYHCGLLERSEFERHVGAAFGETALFSQPRWQGRAEITDEFEVEAGIHDDQEMFIAVATGPLRQALTESAAPPRHARAGSPVPRGEGALRILVFNWHEPYFSLLSRAGHEWIVADWQRRWSSAFRALPANATLCSDPGEAARLISDGRVDLVVAQTVDDLRWLAERRPIPTLFLAHNSLPNEVRGRESGAAETVRALVATALDRAGGLFVAISEMKRESWGLDGTVIPPGIDPADFRAGEGETSGHVASALTVANLLRERGHMLGAAELEAGLTGLPWRVLGVNPALGAAEAPSWEALREAYRSHRVYAHATLWPWEDGYNLALLEAMASGMPVVTWRNPTSPIREGVDGFVADDAEMFRWWATRLLDDRALARRMGAAARRAVFEQFPFDRFVERWRSALQAAVSAGRDRARPARPQRSRSAPASPRRVVLATAWTPISTSAYYERAFRAGHDVVTWGPSMDEATLAEWRQVTERHALKATGSADEKIALLRGLSRPADIPYPAPRAGESAQPSVTELLERLPRGWRPDLFVWIDGGAAFLPRDLERLDCETACLIGDSHTRLDWRQAYAKAFSHVFLMFNRQHVPLFRAAGCMNVAWLPAACDPVVHRAHDVAKAFDVVFVGQTLRQWHGDRVRLLERLIAAGFDVHVTTKILDEMALAFGRGRIVFNRSLAGDLNMRVFEALATGSLLLTDRLAPEAGLDELFRDRVELVCYDEDDLEALARYYLDHDAERRAIARAGREAVLARHTYGHRVASLLATVFGDEPRAIVATSAPDGGAVVASGTSPRHRAAPAAADALPAYYRNERPEIAALVPASAGRVLDVGCAAGALGRALKTSGSRTVVGIEANAAAAAAARAHLDEVIEADLDAAESLPCDEASFDCVICADVLEHLRDPERALRLLRRYLAPGGVLIASIPNVRHAGVLLPLLVDGRFTYTDEGILDRTHLRFFTLAEIVEMFRRNGFELRSAAATRTNEHPAVPRAAALVDELGGDAERFKDESSIVQFILVVDRAQKSTVDADRVAAHGVTSAVPAKSVTDGAALPASPRAVAPAPTVSIVIPVWNRAEFTACCLAALARTIDPRDTEVIVVDNGSIDTTAAVLRDAPLPVRVIRNGENLGFARASNQGARAARGELLVFLNNDTEPEPGWLTALRTAAAEPGVGIAGARLLYPATRRVQHAGLALNPDGIPDHLWRGVPADDPRVTEPRDVEMVTGACLAIRRHLFEEIGGFDEGYRNGVEDVDLCLAVHARSLRVRYEPRAIVLHHEGASEGRFDHVTPNLGRFFQKWEAALAAMPRHAAHEFGALPGPLIAWEGSFFLHHSLAGINRAVCNELLRQGVDLVLTPFEPAEFDPLTVADAAPLTRIIGRPTKTAPVVRVRHRFPPDFDRGPGEKLAIIQPWEFGAVPVEWVSAIREHVDELWVPSEFVRQSFIAGGVRPERVVTIPNGFDPAVFHPDADPLPIPTAKRFRFLYVGGSIPRKGYDVLLRAYVEEFTAADDVCLIVKDHAYYRNRIDQVIAEVRALPNAPEIHYYWESVPPSQMAGFYAAATCLVHPFRGEGFGLPVLEAMACGRPVIVTDAGPVREFCPADGATFVAATVTELGARRVDYLETTGFPTLAEPDLAALRRAMRAAYADPDACAERGRRAAAHAHAHFTWARVASRYAERLRALADDAAAGPSRGAPDRTAALGLLASGRVAEALPVFADLIRRDEDDVEALVAAAHCALALDEVDAARALLTRVHGLAPEHEGARAALAVIAAAAVETAP